MNDIRSLIDIVTENQQPTKMIKTVVLADTQQGLFVKDVDVREVQDTDRFVTGTAQRAAKNHGSEFWGHTTTDKKGAYTIGWGDEDILVVLDPASPWYKTFDPGMEGNYIPQDFEDYYHEHLNH